MQVYISHASSMDYQNELYLPMKEAGFGSAYTFIFPHETNDVVDSKHLISESDIVVAEVSFPSTGQGIELGWASDMGKRIIAFYKTDTKPSSSVKFVTRELVQYGNSNDLIEKMRNII